MKKTMMWAIVFALCFLGGATAMAELPTLFTGRNTTTVKEENTMPAHRCVDALQSSALTETTPCIISDCETKEDLPGIKMPDGTRILQDGTTLLPPKAPRS